jgi:hypothetical protein
LFFYRYLPCLFRLFREGLEAFAVAAFGEELSCVSDDINMNGHQFNSAHDCRNKLFDHLLNFMEQVQVFNILPGFPQQYPIYLIVIVLQSGGFCAGPKSFENVRCPGVS